MMGFVLRRDDQIVAWSMYDQYDGYEPCDDDDPEVVAFLSGQIARAEDYRLAIQHHLDSTARARQYDSALSIASYVTSSVPAWAAEAQAFVVWRDAVWAYALTELAKVQAGERQQPTIEEFIAELPVIEWPTPE